MPTTRDGKEYDDRCSLRFYVNDRRRPGKNDPELTGELIDHEGKKHWLSIWPKTQSDRSKNPGETFWTGNYRIKEDRAPSGRSTLPPARAGARRPVDNDSDLP